MNSRLRRAWTACSLLAVLGTTMSCTRETISEVRAASKLPAAAAPATAADDWPGWGGPQRNHVADGPLEVTTWSPDENILWQADVPGRGHSTPIVVGSRVIVTTAEEDASRQSMLAFDRTSGARLWSVVIHEGTLPRKHSKNSHASATPVSDGHHIFVPFVHGDALYLTSVDLQGNIAWQTKLGPFGSEHGFGSSPLLYGSLIIVNGDNLQDSYIAAVHRDSGQVAWLTKRKTTGRHGSYGTPALASVEGQPLVILSGMEETSAYDPETGELRWSCAGPAEVTACTPAIGGGLIYTSGGYPEKELMAIRPTTTGPLGADAKVWSTAKAITYVPSPLYHDGRLYVVNDGGIITCFAADSGREIWQGRLDGSFSASPMVAGDVLVVPNEAGRVFLVSLGDKFEILGQNQLDVGGFASPVACRGQLFLRTDGRLYCIGRQPSATGTEGEATAP